MSGEQYAKITYLFESEYDTRLPFLSSLDENISRDPWSELQFKDKAYGNDNVKVVTAEKDNAILGYMVYEVIGSTIHLLKLEVKPEAEQHGVREELYKYLIDGIGIMPRSPKHLVVHVRETEEATREMLMDNYKFTLDEKPISRTFYQDCHSYVLHYGEPQQVAEVDKPKAVAKENPPVRWAKDSHDAIRMLSLLFNAAVTRFEPGQDLPKGISFDSKQDNFINRRQGDDSPALVLRIPAESLNVIRPLSLIDHPGNRLANFLRDLELRDDQFSVGAVYSDTSSSAAGGAIERVVAVDAEAYKAKALKLLRMMGNSKVATAVLYFDDMQQYNTEMKDPESEVSKMTRAALRHLKLDRFEHTLIIRDCIGVNKNARLEDYVNEYQSEIDKSGPKWGVG